MGTLAHAKGQLCPPIGLHTLFFSALGRDFRQDKRVQERTQFAFRVFPKRNGEIRRIRCATAARLGRGDALNSCEIGSLN